MSLLAVLIGTTILTNPFPPEPPCDYAMRIRQLNLPANIRSKTTEIDHAASVLYNGKPIGWLLETVRGQLFYQDGPIGSSRFVKQSTNAATMTIEAFGVEPNMENIQNGTIYTIMKPPRLAPLVNNAIEIKGCY